VAFQKATDDQVLAALTKHNGLRGKAAVELGLNERVLLNRIVRMKNKGIAVPDSSYLRPAEKKFEFTPLPEDDVPIEELIEQRKRKFAHDRTAQAQVCPQAIRIKMEEHLHFCQHQIPLVLQHLKHTYLEPKIAA